MGTDKTKTDLQKANFVYRTTYTKLFSANNKDAGLSAECETDVRL